MRGNDKGGGVRGIARTEPYPCGTRASYVHDGCRCAACRAAKATYERNRRRRNAYGRNPWVDAVPVRRHVRGLMAPYPGSGDGIGWARVADLAGVNRGVIRSLIYGATERPPSHRIHRENAERILSVRPVHRLRAPGATMDVRPVVRLSECIHRHGISKRRMAAALGTPQWGIQFGRTITVKRSRAIADLHWRLWRRDPEFRRICECPLPDEIASELAREAS